MSHLARFDSTDLMVRSGLAAVPHCYWCHVAPGHVVSSALQLPSEAWGGKSILEFPPSTSPEAPHQPQGGSQRKEQVLTHLNWGDQLPRFPGLPPPPSLPRGCTQTLLSHRSSQRLENFDNFCFFPCCKSPAGTDLDICLNR